MYVEANIQEIEMDICRMIIVQLLKVSSALAGALFEQLDS